MHIHHTFYRYATHSAEGTLLLDETLPYRDQSLNDIHCRLYKDEFSEFSPKGKTALLYIGGPLEHHSASADHESLHRPSQVIPVKAQVGYMASRTAKLFPNVEYVSINANTCASAMYALHEAERLFAEGYDDVILYGEEWVEPVERKLFEQIGVDLILSDGLFVMHLTNEEKKPAITATSWLWHCDRSEMIFSQEGYLKAFAIAKNKKIDRVKLHGSGTENNTKAELGAVEAFFGKEMPTLSLKDEIGHSQGVSAGLEICMTLDRCEKGETVLCSASGLGNFYGAAILEL